MEPRDSTILKPSGEDSMLIETVKNMVTLEERNELEGKEVYFLVSDVQDVQYSVESSVEETVGDKAQIEQTITWTNLCRICAIMDNQLIPIFEGEGAEHDLSNKILKYLPIHVSKTDTLPLQLCYQCAATLLAWHELSERCLNAERKLLDMQQILQSKNQYFNSTSLDNLEIPAPIINTTTATTIESSMPDQQIDVKSEIRSTEEIDKSNRSCSVRTPFRVFLDTQNIFWKPYRKQCQPTHQRKPYATEDSDSVGIAVIETTTLDQPPAISEQVQNNDALRLSAEVKEQSIVMKQSIRDSEEKNKSCKTAVIHDEKNKGDKIFDSDRKRSNNSRCNKNISEVKKLQKDVIDQGSFQCTECSKYFKLKDSYLRHMRIHKDERPFTCHICGKQFRDSGGLSRHLKDVHAKLKNFTCDLCCKSFASKATRDDHRRTHTGERPYICDSCGKTFKSKASLYIHSKLHTDEFPHLCSYCGKQFRRRQEMLAHVTTHTGEKKHTCDVCAKKFRVKSELVRHKLVHSENKPFVCVKCDLAFRQKRYLNNHIKSRHRESLRAC